jgi:UDP:flavonoid glycosyltransferase YjiC (YdhE family)
MTFSGTSDTIKIRQCITQYRARRIFDRHRMLDDLDRHNSEYCLIVRALVRWSCESGMLAWVFKTSGSVYGRFPVRPELFSLYEWKDLVYVSQISSEMNLILMLSKFSAQIGPKPKRFVFHSTI